MISAEEAKKAIIDNTVQLPVVSKPLEELYGYIAAKNIFSPVNLPPFNQSIMDGYAFIYKDYIGKCKIEIVGEAAAGGVFQFELKSGQAVRIFTGAAIPAGADCVVMQEKVSVSEKLLKILDPELKPFSNIRKTGSQIKQNDLALISGTFLSAGAVGFLASMGINSVSVYRRPEVSVIVTGSELVKPGNIINPGQIYESNSYSLIAALNSINISPSKVQHVSDDETAISRLIENAAASSDVILLSGGISVGDYDFVGTVLQKLNVQTIFYKVKQKPGKPLYFGKIGNVLIFALPGNPAAALTCFYNYVYPALRKMQGFTSFFLKEIELPIAADYTKKKGLSNFLKSQIINGAAMPLDGQESNTLSSFAVADSLIYLPEESESIKKGDLVKVLMLP